MSKSLGCIPDALMDVDWIPSEILARIIVGLTHQDHEGIQTHNVINPHNRDWKTLVPSIQKLIVGEVVTLKTWIEKLKKVNVNDQAEVATKPVLKILDWFSDVEGVQSPGVEMLKYATTKGLEAVSED